MLLLSTFVTFSDQVYVRLRGLDADFGFFLESVQSVDPARQSYSINCAVGLILENFESASTAEAI